MSGPVETDDSRLKCDCGHLLALRWERGAFNVVGTTRIRVDERGRIVLVCPSCGEKTRISKEAA